MKLRQMPCLWRSLLPFYFFTFSPFFQAAKLQNLSKNEKLKMKNELSKAGVSAYQSVLSALSVPSALLALS